MEIQYGLQIGVKFNSDGTPIKYPGNTVIADVGKENPAYAVLHQISSRLRQVKFNDCFIFLPENSYHVTIIRGMNDNVRKSGFWPPELALDTPMDQVDDYFATAAGAVPVSADIRMKFVRLQINGDDVRVCLKPADMEQEQLLKDYRSQVAQRLGFQLPGHDEYIYHVTMAYILKLPGSEYQHQLHEIEESINSCLREQDCFYLSRPCLAYYNDMMQFHPQRFPRM